MLGQACLAEPEHTDAGQSATSVSAALGVAIPDRASLSRTGEEEDRDSLSRTGKTGFAQEMTMPFLPLWSHRNSEWPSMNFRKVPR